MTTLPCIYRGAPTGQTAECRACALRGVQEPLYTCALAAHPLCSVERQVKGGAAWCAICPDRPREEVTPINPADMTHDGCIGESCPHCPKLPRAEYAAVARALNYRPKGQPRQPTAVPREYSAMKFAYGVTTVNTRVERLLPDTLRSLANAGFDQPTIFADCIQDAAVTDIASRLGLSVVNRWPRVRTVGNWVLGMIELYIRNPNADLYVMFQDDIKVSSNLQEYLSRCKLPSTGYYNLCNYPANEVLGNGKVGWYPSNQLGLGAQALAFTKEGLSYLFRSQGTFKKPQNEVWGWRKLDGMIVTALSDAHTGPRGWKEYVHYPSLVMHTGRHSSMQNTIHPASMTFRGEDYNCLELLNSK